MGYEAIGLDFSSEAIHRAQAEHGSDCADFRWLQADLFDEKALAAAGLSPGSLQGVLEHTCFCAIDPAQRGAYVESVQKLLAPGGWLLGLFWFHQEIWELAQGSAPERDNEWLGLWRR